MKKYSKEKSGEENLLDPDAEQHFHIPSAIRNRLDQFDSKNVYIALACEMLARKGAHRDHVSIPANYIREAYGKRVQEALIELNEENFVQRKPYVAPLKQSLEWNFKNGYITWSELESIRDGDQPGEAHKYKFDEEMLDRSKWVVHTEKRKDLHHHTWNAIFDDRRREWEKSSNIRATEELLGELNKSDRPHIKPLALANRRLTFSNKGNTLGRRYTTFGTMKSDLRKHFRLNGDQLVELDVTSSIFFHFFGSLNSHRDALTNDHGRWCPDRTKLMAKKITEPSPEEWFSDLQSTSGHAHKRKKTQLTTQDLHTHYLGIKLTVDYRKRGYIHLDPIIKSASDETDQDFYQLLQGYMEGQYQNPTRNFAKTQANTWANTEDYFHYENSDGEKEENDKRKTFAASIKTDMERGTWKKRDPIGLGPLFDANGGRTGCGMMREEARMMLENIQPSVEQEIQSETLAVHDALYVPQSKAREAKKEMKRTYKEEYGVSPQITCE